MTYGWASLVAQRLKCLPEMWETWVWSLCPEDPLEKEMATHSSILAWRIPWTKEPGGLYSPLGHRVGHDWVISLSFSFTTTPWTVGQAPLSMWFSREEYWNGLSFPSPENLPYPGIKPIISCNGRWTLYHLATCEALGNVYYVINKFWMWKHLSILSYKSAALSGGLPIRLKNKRMHSEGFP